MCLKLFPQVRSSKDDAAVQAKRFGADTAGCAQIRAPTFFPRSCFVLIAGCPLLMILYSLLKGYPSAALPPLLALMLCSCGLCYIDICRMKKDDVKALDAWSDKHIVLEGRVLPYRPWPGCPPCVCSWPGKYASAWDVLVESSSEGGISAAVVFLPEGSQHYGCHDPIPLEEALEGDCWCIPLYSNSWQRSWACGKKSTNFTGKARTGRATPAEPQSKQTKLLMKIGDLLKQLPRDARNDVITNQFSQKQRQDV